MFFLLTHLVDAVNIFFKQDLVILLEMWYEATCHVRQDEGVIFNLEAPPSAHRYSDAV